MLENLFQHFNKAVSREVCEAWALLDQERLVNYARTHLGRAADVELVISRTMHQVMRAVYAGKVPREDMLPYALRTIRNIASTLLRKEAHRAEAERGYARAGQVEAELSIHRKAASAETLDLRIALRQLPADIADVLLLYIWEGHPFADIARMLGVSETTVRRRYQQGITAIRSQLSP